MPQIVSQKQKHTVSLINYDVQLSVFPVILPKEQQEIPIKSSQFLHIALGSLSETETQIIIASKLSYIKNNQNILDDVQTLRKMLTGLIKYLKKKSWKPVNREQWTVNSGKTLSENLKTTSAFNCSPFIFFRQLLVHCFTSSPFTDHFSLIYTVTRSLFTIHGLICSYQFTVHGSLFTVHSSQHFSVHHSRFTVHCFYNL